MDPEAEVNPPKPTETTETPGSGVASDEVGNSANFRSYHILYSRAQIRFLDERILRYSKLC